MGTCDSMEICNGYNEQTSQKVHNRCHKKNSNDNQKVNHPVKPNQTQTIESPKPQEPINKENNSPQNKQKQTIIISETQNQPETRNKENIPQEQINQETKVSVSQNQPETIKNQNIITPQDHLNQTTKLKNNLIDSKNINTQTQISNIGKDNQFLNNQIKQNQTIIADLKNQINECKNMNTQIKNLNIENENKIKELNNKIKALENNNQIYNGIFQLQNFSDKENNMIYVQTITTTINKLRIHYEAKKSKLNERDEKIRQYEKEIIGLKERIRDKIPITIGLENIGATCYMNATLQSLSNTPQLKNYFLIKYKFNLNDKSKIISNEFYIVLKNLWEIKNNQKSYAPHSFKKVLSHENPLFAGIQANDSKDLINFLLERIHKELNEASNQQNINYVITQVDQLDEKKMFTLFLNEFKNKYHSIISDLFYGIMETKSKCLGCGYIKYNFQVYSFLEFPLEQVNKYCLSKGKGNKIKINNKNPDVDLYECFNYYGNIELMTGDNQMYCNICQKNCEALYTTNLYSLPNYLIINLNRGKGAVYECKVNYDEKINLLNFVSYQKGNTYFELYSVI